jgi:YebC/PmpR family DNA-binding regulatory protein
MVECLTDNRNRTVAEVRHAFTKYGGNLGTDGSVAYLFTKIGVLNFAPGTSEDDVMEVALDAGADDVVTEDDGSIEVITSPETYTDVLEAMKAAELMPENSEITQRASLEVELDVETGEKILRFLDALEDLDDTQDVFSNANIPEEAYS